MEQKMCSLTIDKETKQYPLDTTFAAESQMSIRNSLKVELCL